MQYKDLQRLSQLRHDAISSFAPVPRRTACIRCLCLIGNDEGDRCDRTQPRGNATLLKGDQSEDNMLDRAGSLCSRAVAGPGSGVSSWQGSRGGGWGAFGAMLEPNMVDQIGGWAISAFARSTDMSYHLLSRCMSECK